MEIDPVVLVLIILVIVLSTILLSIFALKKGDKDVPKSNIENSSLSSTTTNSSSSKNQSQSKKKSNKHKKNGNENTSTNVNVNGDKDKEINELPVSAPTAVVAASSSTTTAATASSKSKKDNKKTDDSKSTVQKTNVAPVSVPAPIPAPIPAPVPVPAPASAPAVIPELTAAGGSNSSSVEDAKKKKPKETSEQKKARKEREKEKSAQKKLEENSTAIHSNARDTEEISTYIPDINRSRTDSDGWNHVEAKKSKKPVAAPVPAPVTASHGPKSHSVAEITPTTEIVEVDVEDTFPVPGNKIGTIIGNKGSNINGLRDATGVEITVPKERDTPTVVVKLSGTADGITKVKKAFNDLINKGFSSLLGGTDFKEGSVMVHPMYIKEIVGVKGATIRAIQDHFKVKLVVPDDVKDKKECRITVAGSKDKVQAAKDMIKEITKYYHTPITHPGQIHTEMDVPSHLYNHIIGARGSEIKHIQNNYKVQIYIPNADSINKSVVIVGKQQGVDGAQRYIQTKIVDQAGRDDQAAVDVQIAWGQDDNNNHEPWMDEYTIPAPKVAASSQQTKMSSIDGTGAWGTPALSSAEGW